MRWSLGRERLNKEGSEGVQGEETRSRGDSEKSVDNGYNLFAIFCTRM